VQRWTVTLEMCAFQYAFKEFVVIDFIFQQREFYSGVKHVVHRVDYNRSLSTVRRIFTLADKNWNKNLTGNIRLKFVVNLITRVHFIN